MSTTLHVATEQQRDHRDCRLGLAALEQRKHLITIPSKSTKATFIPGCLVRTSERVCAESDFYFYFFLTGYKVIVESPKKPFRSTLGGIRRFIAVAKFGIRIDQWLPKWQKKKKKVLAFQTDPLHSRKQVCLMNSDKLFSSMKKWETSATILVAAFAEIFCICWLDLLTWRPRALPSASFWILFWIFSRQRTVWIFFFHFFFSLLHFWNHPGIQIDLQFCRSVQRERAPYSQAHV